MSIPNYSVLMSVYRKENAENLRIAMDSMWKQTLPTNDFVLICDGPLTAELDAVINDMEKVHSNTLKVIRLTENKGLGNALNVGLKECKNEYIARMDSDDISKPDRCEKEILFLERYPELSIVGSNIEEFDDIKEGSFIPSRANSQRVVPELPGEIRSFAKVRNPFNHPSVIYRKKDVLSVGGYKEVRFIQDYFLWIRMLSKGFNGYNIQEPLLWMRAGDGLFKRKGGIEYLKIQRDLMKYMESVGLVSRFEYSWLVTLRSISSMAPNRLRKCLFKVFLRTKKRNFI